MHGIKHRSADVWDPQRLKAKLLQFRCRLSGFRRVAVSQLNTRHPNTGKFQLNHPFLLSMVLGADEAVRAEASRLLRTLHDVWLRSSCKRHCLIGRTQLEAAHRMIEIGAAYSIKWLCHLATQVPRSG